jgi:type II secretory pathway pseudopilin PulG
MKKTQSGFSIIETLLVVVILGMLGFTGWFVWHAKQNTNKTLSETNAAQTTAPKVAAITTFAECKASAGSVMQETYPETCVTKSGKSFTGPSTSSASTSSAQKIPYSEAPAGLQSTILAFSKTNGCVNDGKIVDSNGNEVNPAVTYQADAYAETAIGCDSPAATLFVYTNDTWQEVESSQGGFSCDTLKKYDISADFLKTASGSSQCINGSELVTYTGA